MLVYPPKMNSECDNPESSSGRWFHAVRPGRDLESNWAVDLGKNLDEYLLKICSGQISRDEDAIFDVNFAEAALLLQGSVQVYSRKVEYLYSLVLHALDFISQKSQEDQATSSAAQAETSIAAGRDEVADSFWALDDIPVEAKNLLDCSNSGDATPSHFVRPPANLVVLEGECLDAGGESGELESYLLATSHLYRDFILLDSCDAVAVDNFLDRGYGKGPTNSCMTSSAISKRRKSFVSPYRQSGGMAPKLIVKRKQDANITQTPSVDHGFEPNDNDIGCSPAHNFSQDDNNEEFGMGSGYSGLRDIDDSDEDEDPWKPLNPHEPGNLKVKPYKRVKAKRKLDVSSRKHQSLLAEFPLAKLHGPIGAELSEVWEARQRVSETHGNSQSLPLYEKLRQSLVAGEKRTNDTFYYPENDIDDNGYDSGGDPDTGPPEFGMPNDAFNSQDVPPLQENREEPEAPASLEDLCRSHMDALLATLAENEKQSELATRVSSWKQRIEYNLEEQDAHPPFDIQRYGESVLDKLSAEAIGETPVPFGYVVETHNKYDVARTFSALLQLVNNGDVDLVRNSPTSSTCYTNVNPFYVQLLRTGKKNKRRLKPFKRKAKTPPRQMKNAKGKENCHASNSPPHGSSSSSRVSINLGKASRSRCTPEGKKRRKSPIVAPLNMQFVG